MKKLFLWILMIITCIVTAQAATFCMDNTYTQDVALDYTNMILNVNRDIASGYRVSAITEITPRLNITVKKCTLYNVTDDATVTLTYNSLKNLDVRNKTGTPKMNIKNYSVSLTSGTVLWNLSGTGVGMWNNKEVYICYNKTYIKNVDNLVTTSDLNSGGSVYSATLGQITDSGVATSTWKIIANDLNNTGWVVTWNQYSVDCSVTNQCQATRGILFAGFGLIALAAIVLAAFLIVNIVKDGNFDGTSIIGITISVISLGVVIMLAYIVIAQVAASVCG